MAKKPIDYKTIKQKFKKWGVAMPEQCPYCGIRPKKKKTCGAPECQYKYHIEQGRKYWDKNYRKTDQVRKSRVNVS